jgi:DNA ligase-1
MKDFAALYAALDASTRTSVKTAALAAYFATASDADKLWTVALFSGRRPRRTIAAARLRDWAAELAGLPDWLFADSYAVVGDLAETIALVLPPPTQDSDLPLSDWIARL